jgi:hypothetical protein
MVSRFSAHERMDKKTCTNMPSASDVGLKVAEVVLSTSGVLQPYIIYIVRFKYSPYSV